MSSLLRAPIVHPHARRHILEAISGKRLSDELAPPNGAAREAPQHPRHRHEHSAATKEVAGVQRKDSACKKGQRKLRRRKKAEAKNKVGCKEWEVEGCVPRSVPGS